MHSQPHRGQQTTIVCDCCLQCQLYILNASLRKKRQNLNFLYILHNNLVSKQYIRTTHTMLAVCKANSSTNVWLTKLHILQPTQQQLSSPVIFEYFYYSSKMYLPSLVCSCQHAMTWNFSQKVIYFQKVFSCNSYYTLQAAVQTHSWTVYKCYSSWDPMQGVCVCVCVASAYTKSIQLKH